jgi:hypothetical protein
MYEIQRLTKDCTPKHDQTVWLWRRHDRSWQLRDWSCLLDQHIDTDWFAYSHWCALVEPPEPRAES